MACGEVYIGMSSFNCSEIDISRLEQANRELATEILNEKATERCDGCGAQSFYLKAGFIECRYCGNHKQLSLQNTNYLH